VTRPLLLLGMLALVACRSSAAATRSTTGTVDAGSSPDLDELRRFDEQVAAAAGRHEQGTLRAMGASTLDAGRAALAVGSNECVGDRLELTVDGDVATSRHVLGYRAPYGGTCTGAHELRLRYVRERGEWWVAEITRYGW
jgi:hypothetical protein